jgi:hypothetical protein
MKRLLKNTSIKKKAMICDFHPPPFFGICGVKSQQLRHLTCAFNVWLLVLGSVFENQTPFLQQESCKISKLFCND